MRRRRRSAIQTFSLSFLDCVCCGFGAVILLFVLTAGQRAATLSDASALLDLSTRSISEAVAAAAALLADERAAREELRAQADAMAEAATSRNARIAQLRARIAELEAARDQLRADARSVEQTLAELPDPEPPPVPVPGTAAREYFTDFRLDGRHVAIVVEGSGGMMANTLAEAMRIATGTADARRNAPKWRRVRAAVRWTTANLTEADYVQIIAFNQRPQLLAPAGSNGWARTNDTAALETALQRLDQWVPEGGAHFENAFQALNRLQPRPDNIILIVDGPPTQGSGITAGMEIDEATRRRLLAESVRQLPSGVPLNIILFPADGDPLAAFDFWGLAIRTQGAMVAPAPDWPRLAPASSAP